MPSKRFVFLLSSLVVSGAANAGLATFSFQGTVNSVSSGLTPDVVVGHTISGTYTFDSNSPGVFTAPANAALGRNNLYFDGALTAASLTVNGQTVSGSGSSWITMNDSAHAAAGNDDYGVGANLASGTVAGFAPERFEVSLFLPFQTWELDATSVLATDVPPLGAATFAGVYLYLDGGQNISARLTSMEAVATVPVPAAAWLFGGGLLVLARAAYRRRERRADTAGGGAAPLASGAAA